MSKNQNVRGVHQPGTPKRGDNKPDANMPANNHGTFPVNLGAGQKSKFGNVNNAPGAAKTGTVNHIGANLNTTNYVNTGQKVSMGTTKHSVGSVPAYLRNPANPK